MTAAELKHETEQLSAEIARGITTMLWDMHKVSLPPAAEKDVGTLVIMNCLPLHALVEKARTVTP